MSCQSFRWISLSGLTGEGPENCWSWWENEHQSWILFIVTKCFYFEVVAEQWFLEIPPRIYWAPIYSHKDHSGILFSLKDGLLVGLDDFTILVIIFSWTHGDYGLWDKTLVRPQSWRAGRQGYSWYFASCDKASHGTDSCGWCCFNKLLCSLLPWT